MAPRVPAWAVLFLSQWHRAVKGLVRIWLKSVPFNRIDQGLHVSPNPVLTSRTFGFRNARPLPANTSRMRLNLPRACRPQNIRLQTTPPGTRRTYAFQAPGGAVFKVFNSRSKWLQKERAAANPELSRQADYLKDEVAMRVCERLLVSKMHKPMQGNPFLLIPNLTSTPKNDRTSNGTSPASST
jgi:hypothetical protein